MQLGPISVSSVDEEYAWLDRHFGRYSRGMQALVSDPKARRMYDVLDITGPDGRQYKVTFDISSFMPYMNPAGQAATEPAGINPWVVLALAFGGLIAYEAGSYYLHRERGRYRNPSGPRSHRYRIETRAAGLPWTSAGLSQAMERPNDFSTASEAGEWIKTMRGWSRDLIGDALWATAEYRVVPIGRKRKA